MPTFCGVAGASATAGLLLMTVPLTAATAVVEDDDENDAVVDGKAPAVVEVDGEVDVVQASSAD
jgi:hypothetical protein